MVDVNVIVKLVSVVVCCTRCGSRVGFVFVGSDRFFFGF